MTNLMRDRSVKEKPGDRDVLKASLSLYIFWSDEK